MKFLLSKLNHIGDALILTPSIRLLRQRFPDAQIDVLVRRGGEQVLQGNPDISRLFVLPASEQEKPWRHFLKLFGGMAFQFYDYAFDFSQSDRARLWMFLSMAKRRCSHNAYGELGWKRHLYTHLSIYKWGKRHQVLRDFYTVIDALDIQAQPSALVINSDVPVRRLIEKFPFLQEEWDYAVIHPTSRWKFKQWLPERWANVADWIYQTYRLKVIFSCGPDERETAHVQEILKHCKEEHHATWGKFTLRELAKLTQHAKLFCGVDTVAMHIAAATQTPTVALFGPSSEWSWRPWECPHELALGACACKQTRKFVCDKSKPYPCMEKISIEQVRGKIQRLIQYAE